MAHFYKGTYKVQNPKKYAGDVSKCVYRSGWERAVFKWLDNNSSIKEWAAEEVVIPYTCATDNKRHRYFIDVYFQLVNGEKFLVEIKPAKETEPPKVPKRKTKRYITEQLTYAKNMSKWKAATEFALDNNCKFQIWTERTIKGLGIKLLGK
jgi:hypothetical protein